MKNYFLIALIGFSFLFSCTKDGEKTPEKDTFVADNYTKSEVDIMMRDCI